MTEQEKDDLIVMLRDRRDFETHRAEAYECKLRETETWLDAARADAKAWKEKFDAADRQAATEYGAKLTVQKQVVRLQDELAAMRVKDRRGPGTWDDLARQVQTLERRKGNHRENRKAAMLESIYTMLVRVRAEKNTHVSRVAASECTEDFDAAKTAVDTFWNLCRED